MTWRLGPKQRGSEVVGDDGLTGSERAGQVPLWMSGSAAEDTPPQTRCEMCHEPAHMANGVLVHDFTGREQCTYKSHL